MPIEEEEIELIRVQVAQQLGWTQLVFSGNGLLVGRPPGKKIIRRVPSYANDIQAAWEITEHLVVKGIWFKIENKPLIGQVRNYYVEIGDGKFGKAQANHVRAPLAICLAFQEFSKRHRIETGDFKA